MTPHNRKGTAIVHFKMAATDRNIKTILTERNCRHFEMNNCGAGRGEPLNIDRKMIHEYSQARIQQSGKNTTVRQEYKCQARIRNIREE